VFIGPPTRGSAAHQPRAEGSIPYGESFGRGQFLKHAGRLWEALLRGPQSFHGRSVVTLGLAGFSRNVNSQGWNKFSNLFHGGRWTESYDRFSTCRSLDVVHKEDLYSPSGQPQTPPPSPRQTATYVLKIGGDAGPRRFLSERQLTGMEQVFKLVLRGTLDRVGFPGNAAPHSETRQTGSSSPRGVKRHGPGIHSPGPVSHSCHLRSLDLPAATGSPGLPCGV
jgi:hypothetical protein